jgi:hypothetical protein
MFLWNLIPAPVRAYVLLALALGLFVGGWYANTVWTGYQQNDDKTKVIEDLGKGQTDIINFNQDFDKGAQDAKKTNTDDCLAKPIPNAIRLLLTPN